MNKKFNYLILILIAYLFIESKDAILSISDGLNLFFKSVLPSLFPFFVLSNMLFALGFANDIAPLFSKIMPKLGLNKNAAFPMLLSFISGYPIGSKTVCNMYQANYFTKNEAQRLLTICSNPSPMFIIATVGITFLNNKTAGIILLFSIYLTAIILCFLTKFFSKREKSTLYNEQQEIQSFYKIFASAVTDSMLNLINILGYILFFSLIINVFNNVFGNVVPKNIIALLNGMIEMTIGCKKIILLSGSNMTLSLICISFILGFGGLCANFQCLSFISKTDLSEKIYLFSKLFYGALNSFITFILLKLLPTSAIDCFYIGYVPTINLDKLLYFQGGVIFLLLFLYILIKKVE